MKWFLFLTILSTSSSYSIPSHKSTLLKTQSSHLELIDINAQPNEPKLSTPQKKQLNHLLLKGNNVTASLGKQKVPLTADSWDAFSITLYTNLFALFFCLSVFGCCQYKSVVFSPRYTHGIANNMVPPMRTNCLSWIRHSLSITNDHIFRHSGLDALSLVMIVELGLQLFVVFMVLNVSILLFGFRRWSMNSICYGSPKLWGHFILATLMVLALMWLIHHHWYEFSKYRRRYLEKLRSAGKKTITTTDTVEGNTTTTTIPLLAIHGRAIVVEGLPDWMYTSEQPDQALYDFFDTLFPNKIDSAVLARDPSSDITSCLYERDCIRIRLEHALAHRRDCLTRDPPLPEPTYVPVVSLVDAPKTYCLCCLGQVKKNVDTLVNGVEEEKENKQNNNDSNTTLTNVEGIRQEMAAIEIKLTTVQQSILGYNICSEMSGYVVFTTAAGRSLAIQALLTTPWEKSKKTTENNQDDDDDDDEEHHNILSAPNIIVRPAPEPRDIVHANVGSAQLRLISGCPSTRVILLRCFNFLLLLFWAAPVALISSLTQLDELEKQFPVLVPLLENSILRGYLQGFLPTLAIVVFMAILPYIFSFLAHAEGMTRQSDIEAAATSRYVLFQIINVLFVSAFAGGMWETMNEIIKNPGSVVDLLGTAIPDTYFFFTSYIMLLAFTIYPVELVQFFPLFTKNYYLSKTKTLREYKAIARPPPITGGYAKQYGYVLLSFAITMEFATVAPMLLPFGVLFFGFGYVILRHHVYYVYDTPYDGEGRMFQWAIGVLCILTIVVLLTLIGIFYSRKSPLQATLMWPLVFLIVVFYWYEEKKHVRSFETLSLQDMKNDNKVNKGSTSNRNNTESPSTIQIEVTSRHYAGMVSIDDLNESQLKQGVVFDLPAAYVYLHPDILKSRLGRMKEITDNEDDLNYEKLVALKKINFKQMPMYQTEQENNMLLVNPRKRKKKKSESSKKGTNEESLLSKKEAKEEAKESGVGGVGGVVKDGIAGVTSLFQKEKDEREEVAGGLFLFRSRWLLWVWSQILAVIFIGGIFYFYHTHANIGKDKCVE